MLEGLIRSSQHALTTFSMKKPEILTGCGIIGFIFTIKEAIVATPRAMASLEEADMYLYETEDFEPTKKEELVTKAKVVAPHYVKTALFGTASILCFCGSLHESNKQVAAAVAAYGIMRDERSSLKEEVEELKQELIEERESKTGKKAKKGKSKNASEENSQKLLTSSSEVIPEAEECLMLDKMSKRYFYCSPLRIKEIEAKLSKDVILEMWVSLNDFYYEIGLEPSTLGDYFGWFAEDDIYFTFSSSMTDDKRPVIEIDYDCSNLKEDGRSRY